MTKPANIRKRRAQRLRAKNPISAVKSRPKEDPRRVALEARQRVLGVSADDAAQPEAGTVLGRLKLAGTITESMYEAGKRYLDLYLAYLKALKAPTGLAAGSSSATGEEASEEYVEWAIRAVAHYEVMRAALADRGKWTVVGVRLVVLHDQDVPDWWMFEAVAGLSVLARKMGLENSQRAA